MLAVAGGKGGAGKTTTALGIARIMAERQPVTVVDADVDMPDLHVITETPSRPGLGEIAEGAPIEACRHAAVDEPGVSVVPAGRETDAVLAALERLRSVDGTVLVDTPAGASRDVTQPLRAADGVVLVSTPTEQSLLDTVKTAALARDLDVPIVGSVLTRSDGTVEAEPILGCRVLAHVPTVADGSPHRSARQHYRRAVRAIRKRNA